MNKSTKMLKEYIDFLRWQQAHHKQNNRKLKRNNYYENIIYDVMAAESIYVRQMITFQILPIIAQRENDKRKNNRFHTL